MYPLSSQKFYWTFESEQKLNLLRQQSNREYVEKQCQNLNFQVQSLYDFFLSPEEERLLLKQYEIQMREFCKRFEPPMPRAIVGTAHHYFKRFYLYNSAMDFHPKEILATCVYLACKVEEFNVSIGQFVSNIKGDRMKATDIILSNELLLMRQLNYYLTIHNPYRPIEGFLIDIKTRTAMINPERLRPGIDEFVDKTFLTDALLLYSPSQIGLAAVLHAASKEQENLDSYVTENLFMNEKDRLPVLIEAVRKIRGMVKNLEYPLRDKVKIIEKKLDKCRNQENNPDSEIYKQKMRKMLEDDETDVIDPSHCLPSSNINVPFYKQKMKKMLEDDETDVIDPSHCLPSSNINVPL